MNIPQNGRIAIVDDNIQQAYPLMELFGKHQIPFTYYNGQLLGLPDEKRANNDIRLLFLDLYLTGDQLKSDKDLKSTILPVLNRIISDNNYPYLLIFWSRHDADKGKIVEEIFKNELKQKAPINFLTLEKSEYFDLLGEKTALYHDKIPDLFEKIDAAMIKFPVYGHLMAWENLIHSSADNTLEEVFKINHTGPDWDNKSNYLFYRLASSFSGKNLQSFTDLERIKSGFYSLNLILNDSIEHSITTKLKIDNPKLTSSKDGIDLDAIFSINKKLLFSSESSDKVSPGIISITIADKHNYGGILNSAFLRHVLFDEKKRTFSRRLKDIAEADIKPQKKKIADEIYDKIKTRMKKTWLPIEANVTPICDFVQCKEEYSRILPGILLERTFKKYIDTKTEALFISPDFKLNIPEKNVDSIYFLLLDFRYFTSIKKAELKTQMNPILRIRQQLLTEIQSKLSRHVNRQGILFLEE
jgi:hypothetical protein